MDIKLHHLDPALLAANGQGVINAAAKKDDPEALRRACQDFEAVFIQQMFKEMRRTVPQGGMLEKSSAQEMFEELMDVEMARDAARSGIFGIAEALFRQLSAAGADSPATLLKTGK